MEREISLQAFELSDEEGVRVGRWRDRAELFARVEKKSALAVYADFAQAKRAAVTFTVRAEADVTKRDRILYGGTPHIIMEIRERDADYLEIGCAAVREAACNVWRTVERAGGNKASVRELREVMRFPAVLGERYVRFSQPVPQDRTETLYDLVTPKPVALETGDLVEIDGARYAVRVCHPLDEYKNEYEIARKEEH